jgi:AcrR family transcriptional regulator
MPQPTERADRILDAAGELLLRLGYRKVTIEDIARQAAIGKGTVYLHWRTKEKLFEALFLRESVGLINELIDRVRHDPEEVRPHRFLRASFLATHDRPLMHALVTDNGDLLGTLKQRAPGDQEFADRYFELIYKYDLVLGDVPNLVFALSATIAGFFLPDSVNPRVEDLATEAKADALGRVVRCAFEPEHGPDRASLTAAAAEIAALFDEINENYRASIYI